MQTVTIWYYKLLTWKEAKIKEAKMKLKNLVFEIKKNIFNNNFIFKRDKDNKIVNILLLLLIIIIWKKIKSKSDIFR